MGLYVCVHKLQRIQVVASIANSYNSSSNNNWHGRYRIGNISSAIGDAQQCGWFLELSFWFSNFTDTVSGYSGEFLDMRNTQWPTHPSLVLMLACACFPVHHLHLCSLCAPVSVCVCACVCVRACGRACVRVYMRVSLPLSLARARNGELQMQKLRFPGHLLRIQSCKSSPFRTVKSSHLIPSVGQSPYIVMRASPLPGVSSFLHPRSIQRRSFQILSWFLSLR